jgi:adenylosuccinate synthase
MSHLQVVVGGQFGSEAKGHVAGWLARRSHKPLCVRVAGPNAGHSVVHPTTGKKYALRQIPVGAVTNPRATLAIAAGSEIDPEVLWQELKLLDDDGLAVSSRLYIDQAATVLHPRHRHREAAEQLVEMIGSTGKGIGAARAERIMRQAAIAAEHHMHAMRVVDVAELIQHCRAAARDVQIEGTQGYGLGLHTQYYPQVTSSDCTAIDFLAMARVNPWQWRRDQVEIWVVFRPHPIRVAGNSGPLHGETSWEELGLPEEKTTVTQKIRRVGTWDPDLARAAVAANGGYFERAGDPKPIHIALTMADQLDPALAGVTDRDILLKSAAFNDFRLQICDDLDYPLSLVTTSDRTVVDLTDEPIH